MRKILTVMSVVLLLQGCAGLTFYSKQDLSGDSKTGIPIYPPKPYLMVSRTGATDKPVETSIVYLPDRAKVYFAKARSGFGSANLSLAFTNGMLTSFGQETDPKIDELITSIAGVPGALAGARKENAEAEKILNDIMAARDQSSPLNQYADKLKSAADDLAALKNDAGYSAAFSATDNVMIERTASRLNDLATDFSDPSANAKQAELVGELNTVYDQLSGVRSASSPLLDGDAANVWNKFEAIKQGLSNTVAALKPAPTPPPSVELYEIVMDGSGRSSLRLVGVKE